MYFRKVRYLQICSDFKLQYSNFMHSKIFYMKTLRLEMEAHL